MRPYNCFGLFVLPGGRPLRFACVIHLGGLPRPLLRPLAIRSSTWIDSSTCARSARRSASILFMSIEGMIAQFSGWGPAGDNWAVRSALAAVGG